MAETEEVISTRQLHIVDENGRPRIVLGVREIGAYIAFLGPDGTMRGQLSLLPNNDMKLLLHDTAGVGRLQVLVGENEDAAWIAGLTLFHNTEEATPSFMLATSSNGESAMFFLDEDGNAMWKVP